MTIPKVGSQQWQDIEAAKAQEHNGCCEYCGRPQGYVLLDEKGQYARLADSFDQAISTAPHTASFYNSNGEVMYTMNVTADDIRHYATRDAFLLEDGLIILSGIRAIKSRNRLAAINRAKGVLAWLCTGCLADHFKASINNT